MHRCIELRIETKLYWYIKEWIRTQGSRFSCLTCRKSELRIEFILTGWTEIWVIWVSRVGQEFERWQPPGYITGMILTPEDRRWPWESFLCVIFKSHGFRRVFRISWRSRGSTGRFTRKLSLPIIDNICNLMKSKQNCISHTKCTPFALNFLQLNTTPHLAPLQSFQQRIWHAYNQLLFLLASSILILLQSDKTFHKYDDKIWSKTRTTSIDGMFNRCECLRMYGIIEQKNVPNSGKVKINSSDEGWSLPICSKYSLILSTKTTGCTWISGEIQARRSGISDASRHPSSFRRGTICNFFFFENTIQKIGNMSISTYFHSKPTCINFFSLVSLIWKYLPDIFTLFLLSGKENRIKLYKQYFDSKSRLRMFSLVLVNSA